MLGENPPSWIPKGIRGHIEFFRDQAKWWDSKHGSSPFFLPLDHVGMEWHGQTSCWIATWGQKIRLTEEIRWIASLDWWQEICIELSGTSYDQLVVVTHSLPVVHFRDDPGSTKQCCSEWVELHQVFSILGWCTSSTARVMYKYSIIQYSKSVFFPWKHMSVSENGLYMAIPCYIILYNGDSWWLYIYITYNRPLGFGGILFRDGGSRFFSLRGHALVCLRHQLSSTNRCDLRGASRMSGHDSWNRRVLQEVLVPTWSSISEK